MGKPAKRDAVKGAVTDRRLEYVPLSELRAAPRNPKLHAAEDISTSLGRFGYVEPVVLDERTGTLVAGHGRTQALLTQKAAGKPAPEGVHSENGEWLVPVIRGWASKDDAEAEGYLVASNQLTIAGGWDSGPLTEMLRGLAAQDALDGLGFEAGALEALLAAPPISGGAEAPSDPDDVPDLPTTSWVKAGDLFELGRHRLLCGDSTKPEDITWLMAGAQADICWTDPPWNVAYGESSNPVGWSKKHAPIANDNLGDAFPGFCAAFCGQIAAVLKPGAPLYMAMSAQEWPTIHAGLVAAGFHWSSSIIWTKDSLVLSRKDYHTQYEPIWYGWRDGSARLVELEDRKQSDVWPIPRPKRSDEHPTMKPVELIARALKNSSRRKGVCFEPFSGSGSTLIACEATGRACRAIELEPRYVQVALERWEKFTGRKATKLES